ncbi:hypothetical protein AB0M39_10420 [Streptomyces sp. NPDC051907]|uniref:hypothetical protein n=1 Tax=Streptomyces sp. NPDC051907 TaxID=3155284 RepID=UPI00343ADE20
MCNLIQALVLWARAVFAPRTSGRHRLRAGDRMADCVQPRPPRLPDVPWLLPAARSPYGLHLPLNGQETAMVRPYVLADEQRQRRLALVLAADFGVDVDAHLLGAHGVV